LQEFAKVDLLPVEVLVEDTDLQERKATAKSTALIPTQTGGVGVLTFSAAANVRQRQRQKHAMYVIKGLIANCISQQPFKLGELFF
jgi:hypothetical protein